MSRAKETRTIARVVIAAGGTVELTARGRLKVTGPAGVAIVGSASSPRSLVTAWRTIERHAGLKVAVGRVPTQKNT